MSRFDAINFMRLTSDEQDLDVFGAKFKNIRYNLPAERTIQLKAEDAHNLPGLAFRLLGDTSLWWVLLDFNGLYDAIEDIRPGMYLRIPSRTNLIAYLETAADTTSNLII